MATSKWALDPSHSEIQFKVKHMMVSNVTGNFGQFDVNVETVGDDFQQANISFSADINSISTGTTQRDDHLKSPDFFDAATYPKLTFVSTSFNKVDDEEYELIGNLTIKDVTKPVKLKVEFGGSGKDPWGNKKAGFSIQGKVDRKDFGLNWNAALETGGVLVGDEVKLSAEIQLAEVVEA
ncbi:YceI family protein [Solitalea sp. MAHUQ-68]|uniref:YceI family protein n=1 Tax=Solitalea agri TaxID=2953739 RepID=A0A9X2F076_9SPHI|nr:YceI family protein [Solitalea agri]MCO4291709.1 YceI family protein [Solitalea agri]